MYKVSLLIIGIIITGGANAQRGDISANRAGGAAGRRAPRAARSATVNRGVGDSNESRADSEPVGETQTFEHAYSESEQTRAPALNNAAAGALRSDQDIEEILGNLGREISDARGVCSAISPSISNLKTAAGISTVSSGIGTIAAGVALTTGLIKAKLDKNLDALNFARTVEGCREEGLTTPACKEALGDRTKIIAYITKLHEMTKDNSKELKAEIEAQIQKSKDLGNVRTITLGAAGVTSLVASISSFVGASGFDKVIDDMSDCQRRAGRIKNMNVQVDALLQDRSVMNSTWGPRLSAVNVAADRVSQSCASFDTNNIKTIKNQMLASGVVSAIGTATGTVGTVMSHKANSDKTRADNTPNGMQKRKNLNTGANIMAGVTAATSLTSTVLSGVSLAGLDKNHSAAKDCAAAFN